MRKTVILGGGLTGLSTAWKLIEDTDRSVEILELQDQLGGMSSTFRYKEYLLDYGPHKIYTQMPEILNIVKGLIGNDLLMIPKKSKVRLRGKYFDYPLGLKSILLGMSPTISLGCGLDFIKITFSNLIQKKKDITYKDYVINRFGTGIYRLVLEPYAKKVWGNPEGLSSELARTRIAIPSMFALLKNMVLGNKNKPKISADQFYYPKDGIVMLSEAFSNKIKSKGGKILKKADTKRIEIRNDRVNKLVYEKYGEKFEVQVDTLISTIPIKKLIPLIHPTPPKQVIDSAFALRYRSLVLFYVIVNKPRLFNDNWIFFPEEEFTFNRLSEQKGFSESMVPKDKTVLTVEITCDADSKFYKSSKEDAFKIVIKDLERANILKESDVLDFFIVKIQDVYPIYNLNFRKNIGVIQEYLHSIKNLYTNGRQGLFNYNNMDHCIDMGIVLAKHIKNDGTKNDWKQENKKFDDYKIID